VLFDIFSQNCCVTKLTGFWVLITVVPAMFAKILSGKILFTKFASFWSFWALFLKMFHFISSLDILFAVNARFKNKDALVNVDWNSTSVVLKFTHEETITLGDLPLT